MKEGSRDGLETSSSTLKLEAQSHPNAVWDRCRARTGRESFGVAGIVLQRCKQCIPPRPVRLFPEPKEQPPNVTDLR